MLVSFVFHTKSAIFYKWSFSNVKCSEIRKKRYKGCYKRYKSVTNVTNVTCVFSVTQGERGGEMLIYIKYIIYYI